MRNGDVTCPVANGNFRNAKSHANSGGKQWRTPPKPETVSNAGLCGNSPKPVYGANSTVPNVMGAGKFNV